MIKPTLIYFRDTERKRNSLCQRQEIVLTMFLGSFNDAYKELDKAKLLLLKLIHLFAREVLLVKKLDIEETMTT